MRSRQGGSLHNNSPTTFCSHCSPRFPIVVRFLPPSSNHSISLSPPPYPPPPYLCVCVCEEVSLLDRLSVPDCYRVVSSVEGVQGDGMRAWCSRLYDCYLPSLVEVIVSIRNRRGMITDRAFLPRRPRCCCLSGSV